MNTVLIAEDEKILRAGLKTMVGRAGVQVGEILEARDGQEALEILRTRRVDLLITDIRMPRMDGIELVSRLSELDYALTVLVVSGYDDFTYAVEMLRKGAQDYLLKPVEREQLYAAIQKAEGQFQSREAARENNEREYLDALRHLMLDPDAEGDEWRNRLDRYGGRFFTGTYIGFCSVAGDRQIPEPVLKLHAVGQVLFYAVPEDRSAMLEENLSQPLGKSDPHRGLETLHICYREAYSAWQTSFFTGRTCAFKAAAYQPLNVTAKQLAGLVGLSKWQDASRLLRGETARVFRGEVAPEAFARLCNQFIGQLERTYPEFTDGALRAYGSIWGFGGIHAYLKALDSWLEAFCARTAAAFSDFENKRKIRQAVQYIQIHFREPLSMAEVSNRVSMNYSLFSTLFKQYTGVNFVSYLQNLRIEESKRLLETTDWYVFEVGRRTGFTDDKHFLKVFKAATGFSPSEYRKSRLLLDRKDGENE